MVKEEDILSGGSMFGVKDIVKKLLILGIILLPWEVFLVYYVVNVFV